MNHVMVAGHLGADPEVRFTSNGQKVTTLRIGCRARRGSKDETIWWRITIWGEQFDKMMTHFKKGSSLIVYGDMTKPEIYTDRDGQPQISMNMTATSMHFSPFGKSDQGTQQHTHAAPAQENKSVQEPAFAQANQASAFGQQQSSDIAFSDDDVPF